MFTPSRSDASSFVGVGIALGLAFGAALGNVGVGLALGMGVGAALARVRR